MTLYVCLFWPRLVFGWSFNGDPSIKIEIKPIDVDLKKNFIFFLMKQRNTLICMADWDLSDWPISTFICPLIFLPSIHLSILLCPCCCLSFIFTYSTHTLGLFDINNVMTQVHQDWSVRATWAILNQYIVFILLLCTGFYIILCLLYEIDSLITSGITLCVCGLEYYLIKLESKQRFVYTYLVSVQLKLLPVSS